MLNLSKRFYLFQNKSASMEELETPTPSLKSFNFNINSQNIATSGAIAEPQVTVLYFLLGLFNMNGHVDNSTPFLDCPNF